jgi:hypothetical protein
MRSVDRKDQTASRERRSTQEATKLAITPETSQSPTLSETHVAKAQIRLASTHTPISRYYSKSVYIPSIAASLSTFPL